MRNFRIILLIILTMTMACQPDDNFEPDPIVSDDARDKFVGNWVCSEDSRIDGQSIFTVSISKSTQNDTMIILNNFYHSGNDEITNAIVNENIITIPQQIICEGVENITVWGEGERLTSNTISWLYYADDGTETDTVTATFTKQ